MKSLDVKTIQGNCGGVGAWINNALSSPAPGPIYYYKSTGNNQRGGGARSKARSKARNKNRKYARKTKSKSIRKRKTKRIIK